jgi:hypothetical protein
MRKPKGYRGINHETIGSDILSVLRVCTLPRQVLGAQISDQLADVKPDGWYPISMLLDPMEFMAQRVGHVGLLQMGWALFKLSHEELVKKTARSGADIVFGLDDMYHHANRGQDIGGWRVMAFTPGYAKLEKTTPHHCWMEEGILAEALRAVGIAASVSQSSCFRQGADACIYEIRSPIRDERWMGQRVAIPSQ